MWILAIGWSTLFVIDELELKTLEDCSITLCVVTYSPLRLPTCRCAVISNPFDGWLAMISTCTDVWWTRPIQMNATRSLTCLLVASYEQRFTMAYKLLFLYYQTYPYARPVDMYPWYCSLVLFHFIQGVTFILLNAILRATIWSLNSGYIAKPTFGLYFYTVVYKLKLLAYASQYNMCISLLYAYRNSKGPHTIAHATGCTKICIPWYCERMIAK